MLEFNSLGDIFPEFADDFFRVQDVEDKDILNLESEEKNYSFEFNATGKIFVEIKIDTHYKQSDRYYYNGTYDYCGMRICVSESRKETEEEYLKRVTLKIKEQLAPLANFDSTRSFYLKMMKGFVLEEEMGDKYPFKKEEA